MNDNKLQNIKKVGRVVAKILEKTKIMVKSDLCGKDLEMAAKKMMEENNVFSSSFGYNGFPAYICVSVSNDQESELTHGIPTDILFKKGDLVKIDVACYLKDEQGICYHADAAITTIVDEENNEKKNNLLEVTKNSLDYVINQIQPGLTTIQDIGFMIQQYVESRGYYVIKEYGGHGIGNNLHEEPFVPNYGRSLNKQVIKPGTFLCIEPLVQEKDNKITTKKVKLNDNNVWEIVISTNNYKNAHFEHTIYIDKQRAIILTINN